MLAVRTFRRLFPFAVTLLLLPARPATAADCCTAAASSDTLGTDAAPHHLLLAAVPASSWMFLEPKVGHLPKRAGGQQFDYMVEPHLWLMGGVQQLPTGVPLTAETSAVDRTSFSQAGVGVGYMLSHKLRATSNWNTGLGRYNVAPGSQFTLGIAVRY